MHDLLKSTPHSPQGYGYFLLCLDFCGFKLAFLLQTAGRQSADENLKGGLAWLPFDRFAGTQPCKHHTRPYVDILNALISVERSKCASQVGLTGIVVQETENVFRIVTTLDAIKSLVFFVVFLLLASPFHALLPVAAVPKQNNVFVFDFEGCRFTLFGNHLRSALSDVVFALFGG